MKQKLKLNTIFSAAFGAALSYYGFTPVLRSRFAIPVVFTVLALIMLLVVLNIIFNNGNSYQNGRRKLFFIAFAAGFLLGFFSLTAARRAAILRFGLPDNEITGIAGQLLDDPRSSTSGRGLATLNLNESAGHGGVRTSAKGHITVFFTEEAMPRLKEFGRGSKVFVEGNFITAKNGLLFKAKSTHITAPPSSLNALRTKLRRGLTSIFNNERWGGLALALLLGIKDNLDGEMAERYRDAGCSYILALSGMHLAIVSSIVAFLLKKPLGVRPATIIGALFIVLYIYLVGAQPSLVRAGIAALLGALALFCSFPTSALHLLALSFLTQLVIDPGSGGTISFILSYLALAGILIFGEPVDGVIKGRLPEFISKPLSASLGAFLATMAVTAVFFGNLRVAGIIAGLVMVPLTTVFMITSIVFLAVQIIPPLAAIMEKPFEFTLSLLYMMLEKIAAFAASLPALPVKNFYIFMAVSCFLPFFTSFLCGWYVKNRNIVKSFIK